MQRFKEKYHPDEADKKFTNQRTSILWRVEVFEKMEKHGIFDRVRLDLENEKEIIKLMDSGKHKYTVAIIHKYFSHWHHISPTFLLNNSATGIACFLSAFPHRYHFSLMVEL